VTGFAIATYLALYQSGVFPGVWEPFFGRGSEVILHSWVSRLLPVPDAALGAAAYLAEAVASVVGGPDRWRSRPGAVLVYGGLSGLLGLVGLTLLVCQPLVFGAWCTLCLASAAISVTLAILASGEVRAAVRQWKCKQVLRTAQYE
jgi:uncharacterized membrane protein